MWSNMACGASSTFQIQLTRLNHGICSRINPYFHWTMSERSFHIRRVISIGPVFSYTFANPIELHIHLFLMLLFYGGICDAVLRGVIGGDGSW